MLDVAEPRSEATRPAPPPRRVTAASYRPDIDGLRTVAVLSVVVFHLGTSVLSGGFVGVDVFFVISGYLITGTLLMAKGSYAQGLADFYKRRIKRIFPALFVVYAAVMLFAFATLFADETRGIALTTVASIFFVSNILFFSSSGYFDGGLDSNPLLHTWSLSVEEQFYIFFPLVLFFSRNWAAKTRIALVAGIALVSFVASGWRVQGDMNAAFYLVQYRTWELALGSLLAMGAFPEARSALVAQLETLAGLALIAAAVVLYDRTTPFPGPAALLPCVGSALIIHGGTAHRTLVGGLLSTPPARFIGLISYSLYLWHWPIIVFYRSFDHRLTMTDRGWLLIASVVLAALSWYLVEQPFRGRNRLMGSKRVILGGLAAMVVASAAALGAAKISAIFWPISPAARQVLAYLDSDGQSEGMRTGTCFLASQAAFDSFDRKACLTPVADKPNILLIGDSHGAHFYHGLAAALPDYHILQATASGCKPLLTNHGEKRCVALMHYIFNEFVPTHRLDGVVISARWQKDEADAAVAAARRLREFVPHVVVSGPIVEYDVALPRVLARNIDYGESIAAHRVAEISKVDRTFAQAFARARLPYVSPYGAACHPECDVWARPGVPLQFDYGHMTAEGSTLIVGRLGPAIRADLGGKEPR
jgi:peptidoglycan/LPS O-acetylase OafA/YrhL